MFVSRFVRKCWTIVVPLSAVFATSVLLFMVGKKDAAFYVSNLSTMGVLVGNILYIMKVDPNSRSPRLSPIELNGRRMSPQDSVAQSRADSCLPGGWDR